MSEDELRLNAKALLLKISVIAGWVLPEDDMLILVDQFQKKMAEGYANVNAAEIEYAIRNNTSVKDWGKSMNLFMIDEVMLPYLETRRQLSVLEEQAAHKQLEAPKEDLGDEAMRLWLENIQAQVRADEIKPDFMPLMLYDWARKKKMLKVTNRLWNETLIKARDHRQAELITLFELDEKHGKDLEAFNKMKEVDEFTGKEVSIIQNLAKKIIFFYFLKHEPRDTTTVAGEDKRSGV